jgi:hypothetical protein
MKRISLAIIISLFMLSASACASRPMSVRVDMPASKSPDAFTHSVVIKAARDLRKFQPREASPRSQSWGSSIASMHTPAFQAQVVARNSQLNGRDYGGNVLLEGDQTVMSMVTGATYEGFSRAGYAALTTLAPPEGTPEVTIDIDKLWGWFEHKRLNSTVASELETRVTLTYADGSSNTITVKTAVKNSALHYSPENWKKSLDALMEAYADGLAKELKKLDVKSGI